MLMFKHLKIQTGESRIRGSLRRHQIARKWFEKSLPKNVDDNNVGNNKEFAVIVENLETEKQQRLADLDFLVEATRNDIEDQHELQLTLLKEAMEVEIDSKAHFSVSLFLEMMSFLNALLCRKGS